MTGTLSWMRRQTLLTGAAAVAAAALAMAVARVSAWMGVDAWWGGAVALVAAACIGTWAARAFGWRDSERLVAIEEAVRGFGENDFSIRLAGAGEGELGGLVQAFNEVAGRLSIRRSDAYQHELLLDTILQASPVSIVLTNSASRVVFANSAARELLGGGRRLQGQYFEEIVASLPAPVREAIAGVAESVFNVRSGDRDETFRLVRRRFHLNTLEHTLFMLERLTPELRRQEVEVWKRAIRTMNHELNNSIAPLSSLLHSARLAMRNPQHATKLDEIYDTIEDRLSHLRDFLEAYARFARLPKPRRSVVEWPAVLEDVRRLYLFRLEAPSAAKGFFDRPQMEQVLINLVKNAHEAGGPVEAIEVVLAAGSEETTLRVLDRGRGMSDSVLGQALLPFYSTKPDGTGLGLALVAEIVDAHDGRLALQRRDGGGMAVSVTIPSPGALALSPKP